MNQLKLNHKPLEEVLEKSFLIKIYIIHTSYYFIGMLEWVCAPWLPESVAFALLLLFSW